MEAVKHVASSSYLKDFKDIGIHTLKAAFYLILFSVIFGLAALSINARVSSARAFQELLKGYGLDKRKNCSYA
jgi:hypothetical protein